MLHVILSELNKLHPHAVMKRKINANIKNKRKENKKGIKVSQKIQRREGYVCTRDSCNAKNDTTRQQ